MYARKNILLLFLTVLFMSCQEKRADFFERDAKEYTEKKCPQQMDAFTTLDSIVFKKDLGAGTLVQYYTLDLSPEQRELLMNKLGDLQNENLRVIRNSIPLHSHREAGVDFSYIYLDRDSGEKIAEFTYTKKDYE